MKILVTGAAGFIGSHLCEALLRRGDSVVGLDNFNSFYEPRLKEANVSAIEKTAQKSSASFELVRGDLNDLSLLENIFLEHKPDAVVHLAAMAGVRPSLQNPLLYEQVNGLGTASLLEAMRKAKVSKLVFGSSSSVYGTNAKVPFSEIDPIHLTISPYAATKRANELQCHVYYHVHQFTIASLRFFTVYGPRQRPDLAIRKFTDLIYQGKPIDIYGDGSFARDFTYVDDIIDGVVKSLDWVIQSKTPQFEIFNLGESETTTVTQLVELIEKTTGKKAEKKFHAAQPGDVPVTFADISKAKKILGYNPTTPISQGIKKFVAWFEKEGRA